MLRPPLYAALRIVEGLIIIALEVQPLAFIRVVRLHWPVLQRRICGPYKTACGEAASRKLPSHDITSTTHDRRLFFAQPAPGLSEPVAVASQAYEYHRLQGGRNAGPNVPFPSPELFALGASPKDRASFDLWIGPSTSARLGEAPTLTCAPQAA